MKKQLTESQVSKLIALGVPATKGSPFTDGGQTGHTFTLSDMFGLLPSEVYDPESQRTYNMTTISFNGYYYASYTIKGEGKHSKVTISETELIDALYDLARWCIENDFAKEEFTK